MMRKERFPPFGERDGTMTQNQTMDDPTRRKTELKSFLFLAVVLAPALAVAIVGGLGFSIWIYQMFAGPPGPPV